MNRTLTLEPIGIIHTAFTNRYDAPRQPEGQTPARIELFAGRNYEQALDGLQGFDYIWVLFWFDRNDRWRPKVLPPRGRIKRGVFATRSPHRPNPIGLSLLQLRSVDGRFLDVIGCDLLDESPILDIKPYLPYAEARADARAGWLDEVVASETVYDVRWDQPAAEQVQWLLTHHGIDIGGHVERVLRFDPHPHPYRRIAQSADGTSVLAVRSWRVVFQVDGAAVTIRRIASGYDPTVLERSSDARRFDAYDAHVAFHRRWS